MSFLEKLSWRYATKKFDTKKLVSEEDTSKIMEAIRMAPTSFGVQPFHVTVVESKDIREELKKNAWNQSQFTDAPLLFIFSSRSDLANRVDEYMNVMSGGDSAKRAGLKGAEDMMKGALASKNEIDAKAWAAKQAYIAFGFGLAAAAELGLDLVQWKGLMQGLSRKYSDFRKIFMCKRRLRWVIVQRMMQLQKGRR